MEPVRSSNSTARVALGLAGLLACAAPARAQSFAELGGGWNYPAPAAGLDAYSHGYNVRASLGHRLAPRVRVRFDASVSWFDEKLQWYPPCPYPGCNGPAFQHGTAYVAALSANWLVNVDPRGILYGIGGAGVYDVDGYNGFQQNGVTLGVSAGAGIAVPVGGGLRAFVEARYHVLRIDQVLLGTTARPPWIVPVTFGVRF